MVPAAGGGLCRGPSAPGLAGRPCGQMRIRHSPIASFILRHMERPQYTRDDLVEMMRASGINPTHQRIEIAHTLYSRFEHLCADQVLALVNERHPEVSRATVYNTLNLFVQKGMVREVIADPSRVFYDPNTRPHYHLYDVRTGELTDIDAAGIQLSGLPALPQGVVTEGVDIILRVRSPEPA